MTMQQRDRVADAIVEPPAPELVHTRFSTAEVALEFSGAPTLTTDDFFVV